MKQILLTITTAIFLNGCQTQPQEFISKQCQAVFAYDSRGDIDPRQSFCRCRNYRIAKDFIGSTGNVIRRKLRECDGLIGYSVRENTRLINFLEYVRGEISEAKGIELEENEEFQAGITGKP